MEIQLAVSKVSKYGSPESGDSIEQVERPNGGLSIALCDAKSSGREAKSISSMVVRKVVNLLGEGVRDGAAARAASDFLFTEKNGKVSAYLNILSIDLETSTIVITRNNPSAILVAQQERIECLAGENNPVGSSRNVRPMISEIPLDINTTIVMFTDGITHAGNHYGQKLDICTLLGAILEDQEPTAKEISDSILTQAIRLDQGRPKDDMSLVVLRVLPEDKDDIRRLSISIPFNKDRLAG
jgi:serine phosphatase RsbU (regulator of sigma subunit)